MKSFKITILLFIGICAGFYGFRHFYKCPSINQEECNYGVYYDTIYRLHKEKSECFQSESYRYMQHHRQAIRNLIKQGKHEKKDSFPVDSTEGVNDLIYYDIGGYSFQEDGTLFGRKVMFEATEGMELK